MIEFSCRWRSQRNGALRWELDEYTVRVHGLSPSDTDYVLREFACRCAIAGLARATKHHPSGLAAVVAARRFTRGDITADVLASHRDAAFHASCVATAERAEELARGADETEWSGWCGQWAAAAAADADPQRAADDAVMDAGGWTPALLQTLDDLYDSMGDE